ncbi:MAG TPA: class I SAM-dependent methyltransferase [Rhizomicrobium sp.]|jgi:SAM-dependent methyltransferase|nr:class I SAM-dependent methyltransferase [Rhizomicrobium sp.]
MFHERSYARQANGFARDLVDPDRQKIAASWFDSSTVDYWRHARSYEIADYLGGRKGEKWLTVGDGRFGLDAVRLMGRGVADVLATDLDESLLKSAKEKGVLKHYRVENAEKLSFDDRSFDYAFCKEALHHFPRPAIALYEMLRVSRKGVILIEPSDRIGSWRRKLGVGARRLLGRPRRHMDVGFYEEDGNYIFSISRREIEKVALAINMPQVAFKGLNDYYEPGLEFEPMTSARARKVLRIVKCRDLQCRFGFESHQLLMAILLYEAVPKVAREKMESMGWHFVDLPRNPHIRDE